MSLFSDHDCKMDGQYVNYFKGAGDSVNLNPGQVLTVSLPVVGGVLTAFVETLISRSHRVCGYCMVPKGARSRR
jgi:hypothetical protein